MSLKLLKFKKSYWWLSSLYVGLLESKKEHWKFSGLWNWSHLFIGLLCCYNIKTYLGISNQLEFDIIWEVLQIFIISQMGSTKPSWTNKSFNTRHFDYSRLQWHPSMQGLSKNWGSFSTNPIGPWSKDVGSFSIDLTRSWSMTRNFKVFQQDILIYHHDFSHYYLEDLNLKLK